MRTLTLVIPYILLFTVHGLALWWGFRGKRGVAVRVGLVAAVTASTMAVILGLRKIGQTGSETTDTAYLLLPLMSLVLAAIAFGAGWGAGTIMERARRRRGPRR